MIDREIKTGEPLEEHVKACVLGLAMQVRPLTTSADCDPRSTNVKEVFRCEDNSVWFQSCGSFFFFRELCYCLTNWTPTLQGIHFATS